MSAHTPILQLSEVGVSYSRPSGLLRRKSVWALKNVSFKLYSGETLGVIGRNGAGKTTLLQLLAGIIAPDKGEVISAGARASLLSLQVGFLPHLSGRENIVLGGMLMGMSRRLIRERMDAIVAFAELGEWIEQPVKTYSTGMKARLGFAVSFQADPEILLIDEVLGVGDEHFKDKSTAAMKERVRSDRTVVLVSHSVPTLRELCDRLVWIDDGKTRAEGGVEEILESYLATVRKKQPS